MDQLECSHQTWSSLEEAIECLGTASIAMDSLVGEVALGKIGAIARRGRIGAQHGDAAGIAQAPEHFCGGVAAGAGTGGGGLPVAGSGLPDGGTVPNTTWPCVPPVTS